MVIGCDLERFHINDRVFPNLWIDETLKSACKDAFQNPVNAQQTMLVNCFANALLDSDFSNI